MRGAASLANKLMRDVDGSIGSKSLLLFKVSDAYDATHTFFGP